MKALEERPQPTENSHVQAPTSIPAVTVSRIAINHTHVLPSYFLHPPSPVKQHFAFSFILLNLVANSQKHKPCIQHYHAQQRSESIVVNQTRRTCTLKAKLAKSVMLVDPSQKPLTVSRVSRIASRIASRSNWLVGRSPRSPFARYVHLVF